jgi:hypothetical protein
VVAVSLVRVDHTQCQARGDELCRWEAEVVEESASLVGPALSPEAEAGA